MSEDGAEEMTKMEKRKRSRWSRYDENGDDDMTKVEKRI